MYKRQLSGESAALKYVHGFYYQPEPGDMILLHTDGIEPFTRYAEFIALLRSGLSQEQLVQVIQRYMDAGLIPNPGYSDDKTLIAFQV